MSNDVMSRRLDHNLVKAQNDAFSFARNQNDNPYDIGDMYAFQMAFMDVSNANWANSQYTQFTHGIRKSIIDSIN